MIESTSSPPNFRLGTLGYWPITLERPCAPSVTAQEKAPRHLPRARGRKGGVMKSFPVLFVWTGEIPDGCSETWRTLMA